MNPLGVITLAIGGPALAPIFAVFYGAGNGILTIARGTLRLRCLGRVVSAGGWACYRFRHARREPSRRSPSAFLPNILVPERCGRRRWPRLLPLSRFSFYGRDRRHDGHSDDWP